VSSLTAEFLDAARVVLGSPRPALALHEPEFSDLESTFVQDCLNSTFVSTVGKYVGEFESALSTYTGAPHVIAVVNGTAALELAVRLAGVKAGDEVLVPGLTFVGTANAVSIAGAIPHFVDSGASTPGIDPTLLADYLRLVGERRKGGLINKKTGRRISALLPLHPFGHPADVVDLRQVADSYEIPLVEDAAESLGSRVSGRHTGTFGLLGTLSFNGNKIVTTGGGGAILTADADLASRARHLTTTAKRAHRWEFFHDEVAWNYRMPNLNAALGCAQMHRLDDFVARKRRLADRYRLAFGEMAAFEFVDEPLNTRSNYWLCTIKLRRPDRQARDRILEAANDAGFHCRPVWNLLPTLPMYAACPSAPLPNARNWEDSLICLPSSAKLVGTVR